MIPDDNPEPRTKGGETHIMGQPLTTNHHFQCREDRVPTLKVPLGLRTPHLGPSDESANKFADSSGVGGGEFFFPSVPSPPHAAL